jgi:hypothetical protein
MPDHELPQKDGWYRLTRDGWEWVAEPDAAPGTDNDFAFDVVLFRRDYEEAPLW